VLSTARLGSGSPQVDSNFAIDVLTAVILGGVAFNGGSGHPLGVFFGVATIGVLNAGLIFAGLSDWYQQIAKGVILLLALGMDQFALYRGRRAVRAAAVPTAAEPVGSADGGELLVARSGRTTTTGREPILECAGLRLRYGSVQALRTGALAVHPGEIVCLVGDNGAGKSTLIKILSGVLAPDAGSIRFAGSEIRFGSPSDARRAGIETVYQDLALCPNLGVAHNLILGDEPRRRLLRLLPVRDDREAGRRAAARLESLGIGLPNLHQPVRWLSGGQRQSVAIARALKEDVRLVILDEPTAALGVSQTQHVLEIIRATAERGIGVILISHDVETVVGVADRVVVLRLGEVVHDGPAEELSETELAHLMAGLLPGGRIPRRVTAGAEG
jgi:ABC-type branched-subunit amino acid transport system ATPase component